MKTIDLIEFIPPDPPSPAPVSLVTLNGYPSDAALGCSAGLPAGEGGAGLIEFL